MARKRLYDLPLYRDGERCGTTPLTIEARRGALVVHRTLEGNIPGRRQWWTVTHAATGFAVHKQIPTRARAIALAGALAPWPWGQVKAAEQQARIDGTATLARTPKWWPQAGQVVRRHIEGWKKKRASRDSR